MIIGKKGWEFAAHVAPAYKQLHLHDPTHIISGVMSTGAYFTNRD